MKKCIMISDSFKGTLSSKEICEIAESCMRRYFPDCELIKIPVADGGEGTVACFHEVCGGELISVPVQGPYGEELVADYLRLPGGQAVIEMASAAGLPLVENRKDPCRTSTYGVGQLIRHAVEHGNRNILLGLGGSCTNDGGCGCAAALGVKFTGADGRPFIPTGGTLDQIAGIDVADTVRLLENVSVTAMCDIDNPLYGPTGAACVFAPQKGADEAMTAFLDRQLTVLGGAIEAHLGRAVSSAAGAGAAGGLGAGVMAFLGGELRPGIEAVLNLVKFDELLDGCDLVFTGEGRLDSQSIRGKVISGVAKHARRRHVPVIAVVGSVDPGIEALCDTPDLGLAAVFSINRQAIDFAQSRFSSRENYAHTFSNLLRLIGSVESKQR